MLCHAIQGTTANARKAPDLTHVASRAPLAAGTLPNTPQRSRPGSRIPQRDQARRQHAAACRRADDLVALSAYLGTLK